VSHENLEFVRGGMFSEDVDLVGLVREGRFGDAVDPALFAPDVVVAFITPGGPSTEYHGFEACSPAGATGSPPGRATRWRWRT